MTKCKISIVLPTYNGEKYIKEAIDSILLQDEKDFELIIVNDCSTDKTPEIIEEYSKNNKNIKIVNNQKNLKLPQSLNVGFKEASGEYFTWTSDDNLYKQGALKLMREYLD